MPDPFWAGYADESQYLKELDDPDQVSGMRKPSVVYLIREVKELSEYCTFLETQIKEKIGTIEDFVSSQKRIYSLTQKKSIVDQIKGAFKEEKEE